jgi:hypothetical protein
MSYPASLFNIVGAAYIPERHLESYCDHAERWSSRHYGLGVPRLARDLDIADADAVEMDQAVSDLLK